MFDGEPSPDVTERVLVSTTETTYSYVYDGGQLRQMTVTTTVTADEETTTQTETLSFTYDASGAPQTVTCGANTYLYVTNLQGDVLAILDTDGTPVVEYTYDAWGNLLGTTGSLANTLGADNPLRYRGYVYDTETELYYLQSRYYNPAIGRFINADSYTSTGQGFLGNNMFAYCRNNPVTRKDASGTTDVCNVASEEDGNPFNDYGGPQAGGGGSGVKSSYYARQNVRAYDGWWRNSCYNPNMTWSNGTTTQPATNVDPFDAFVENPESIKGKTASDMSKILGDTWIQGKYGSEGTGWKFTKGDKLIGYHPGGGRHVGSYYKISSSAIGKIKIVGAGYFPIAGDKAIIIWVE